MDERRRVGHVAGLALELDGNRGPVPALLLRDDDGGLVLRLEDPSAYRGLRIRPQVRRASALMAQRGVEVRVVAGEREVMVLGVASAPWWHRVVTGTAHVRLGARPRRRRPARPVTPVRPALSGS
ncbi:hypothetical protein ACOACO_00820 [Nocardioides sp. CPCC 205120]|uniref:hypothetical protein n=1 Tax=Nocardioides sp. CPCC 205120 TaxID=3406462 RepID=UPI003B514FD5